MSKVLQATKFFIFVWLTLIVSGVYAQDYQIKGKVTDVESGLGLPGVNVVVKDAEGNIGTVTDIDGAYSLSVPSGADVLIFSYVGFITQEIQISGRSVIDIIMEEDIEQLGEVVVTALGITREKESLGYAVSDVSGDELAEVKSLNAVNALSGKVAGVDIQQGNTGIGGSSKVTIRGNSKITGSNQPLYVIDGVPMDNASMGQAGEWGGQDLGDGISSINPDDIETISVLKGPAAAALYGTRASNGVILITTKSWNEKDGTKFNVDFTSNMTIDNIVGHYDDIQYIYGQGINTPPRDISDALYLQSWGDKLDPNLEFITFDGQYRDYGIKPNHIGSFFRTGAALQNTVSLSGGNKDASFRFSIGDTKMNDIVQNSGLHRNSFSLRGTMKMWDRLMVDTKATYVREDIDNRPYLGYSGANVALALMALPANFDQHWLEESKTDENGNYIPWHSQSRITNPYYSLYDMVNNSKKNRVMGYTSLNYEFTDWLTLRVKSGIDTYSYLFYDYSPISTPTRESGEMRELNSRTTEINSEFLLTASKQLNEDWYASGSVGGNIMKFESKTIDILAQGQVSAGLITINNYGDFNIQNKIPRKQINSLYAFANVGYKDYLFADVTARNDWSSTLPVDNNSYFYPSITTAFVFTQAFDIRSNILSYGKFRASYAEVGGDTDPYNLRRSYRNYSYNMNGLPLTTNASNIMANPELKPSRTKGYEFGLDAKLFNWRVGMDITYYNQTTFDEIITLPTPPSMGHDYTYYNAGRINNKGVELMINIVPIKQEDVRWDLTLNGARNINKVVELHPEAKVQELARAEWVGSYIHAVEGEAYGDIIGYDFKRDPNGNVIVNANGLPVVSPELSAIGNGQYKFTGGITNTIRYKGFSFRALIDMKFGADILSMTNLKLYQYGVHSGTLEGREAWALSEQERVAAGVTSADWDATGGYLVNGVFEVDNGDGTFSYVENDSTYVNPRDYWSTVANNKIMSPFIYDASYVKFREMSLSYTLQENQLKALKYFKGATLSFVARNIWVIWTNVPNIDPESTYTISNGQGYEYASLPQRRSYGFNLKLNF